MPARRPLLLAGLVLAGAVGLLALIGARIPQAAILLELERAVGHPIEVDQARVRLVPQPALELLDVRAPDAGVLAGCLARFEARRVRLRLAVAPLLRGRAVVSRMDLDGPLLRLVRPAPGQGAAPAAATPPRPPEPSVRPPEPPAAPRRSDAAELAVVRLHRIEVRRGRVQFIDEASGGRWAAGRLRASVRLPDAGATAGPAELAVRAALRRGGREPLAALEVEGRLGWAERRPQFRGVIRSGPFRFGPLRFDGGSGRLVAGARGAHLRDLELALGGGAVAGRARAVLGPDARVALALAGRGEALQEAFERGKVVVSGAWESRLAVQGPAPWRSGARRALGGHGRVVITGGAITPFELGSALLDVLAPLRGRRQSKRLRQRYPEVFDEERLRFARLGGTLRLEGRRARTRDLVVRGRDYRAAARGTLSVDGRLALGLRVALSDALTQDLVGRRSLAAVVGAEPGRGLTVPLRLEGTVAEPRLRARPEWSRALIRRTLGGSGMGDVLERVLR